VARVAELLDGFPTDWYLCGGWAVDAWLGRTTREHKDVDIAVFREALPAVLDHFADWALLAHDARLPDDDQQWTGRPVKLPAHIHARHDDVDLDIQVNERIRGRWQLSRRPQVTADAQRSVGQSAWALPVLSPEIVPFYKAEDTRPHDQQDFNALLPLLDRRQTLWLRQAVGRVHPRHDWLDALISRWFA
jgi:hypothetical protein